VKVPLRQWSVDYGSGRAPVTIPHVWHLDRPLAWEGPAIYRTSVSVPSEPATLVFHGASYEAVVRINGDEVVRHRGIWDAFEVDLAAWQGQKVAVEVEIVKNGGSTWPVPNVASGFIPYVYGTFGGLFREVELVHGSATLTRPVPPSRVSVEGRRIFVDDEPFYARGVLTWGWYPDLATPHLPSERIAREIAQVKSLGFNLIKFCLWMPPHEYLQQMREAGLMAWLELPLWLPAGDEESLAGFRTEIIRIVDQYAHHDNVLAWTIGCELSESTPAEFRRELVEYVKARTGSPMVKDNSGGAEMYGGDPREYGDFADFHPYCDTHFYPVVLDSLLPGPRKEQPILLGEFNDYDVCRDLARVEHEESYWASGNSDLNAQGVRWQFDLPAIMTRYQVDEKLRNRLPNLIESSHRQSVFMRKFVQEQVRAREDISGYVVTGWADTPISTAGFVDDWGQPRFDPRELSSWNGEAAFFLIARRMPPWENGGNRPGWHDPFCHWSENLFIQVGLHTVSGDRHTLVSLRLDGRDVTDQVHGNFEPLGAAEVAFVFKHEYPVGEHRLEAWRLLDLPEPEEMALNEWPLTLVDPVKDPWPLTLDDPRQAFSGLKTTSHGPSVGTNPRADGLVFLLDEGTIPRPFWRETAHEWDAEFWGDWVEAWHRFLAISPDRAIDPAWLKANLDDYQVVWNRVDMRTFEELPLVVRGTRAGKPIIVTTLRPFGGLGSQPFGVDRSPAGTLLLRHFLRVFEACR
jgi:hypothetical protein